MGDLVKKTLPPERKAVVHKFSVGGHDGYLTVGLFDDGSPGEIFISIAKEGSTLSGLLDCFAISISMALQYGVALPDLCRKFKDMRFEPQGITGNREIPMASSIVDYIFKYLEKRFAGGPIENR